MMKPFIHELTIAKGSRLQLNWRKHFVTVEYYDSDTGGGSDDIPVGDISQKVGWLTGQAIAQDPKAFLEYVWSIYRDSNQEDEALDVAVLSFCDGHYRPGRVR